MLTLIGVSKNVVYNQITAMPWNITTSRLWSSQGKQVNAVPMFMFVCSFFSYMKSYHLNQDIRMRHS